ncbi:MAG: prepilin-type N-terminal cleavage/methylation domain-containing protein [Phycisphaera sp.]|nr:prepilin-type N-terminal cleavage/methylation domain-containing protein [Phycisphaera sp.]
MSYSTQRRTGFTLVELLVVVAIIAVLIAILLPSLNRARYQAKLVVCKSQMHQQCIGVTSYGTDYEGFYPEAPAQDPSVKLRGRGDLYTIASRFNHYDLRDSLRPYLGSQLNKILKCPLASDVWLDNNDGWTGDAQYTNIDRPFDKGYGKFRMTYGWYFGESYNSDYATLPFLEQSGCWLIKARKKLGENFVPNKGTAAGREVRVLVSDYNSKANLTSASTAHRGYTADLPEGGNWDLGEMGYLLNDVAQAVTTVNYCLDDGSTTSYQIGTYMQPSGWYSSKSTTLFSGLLFPPDSVR